MPEDPYTAEELEVRWRMFYRLNEPSLADEFYDMYVEYMTVPRD
jgi:hypothetical protein